MSVLAPPPQDELELLIREARARARRRKLLLAAAVGIIAAIGLALWAAVPGGGHASRSGGAPGGGAGHISSGGRVAIRAVSDVGSSADVTWVVNGRGVWLTHNAGRTWRKLTLPQGTGRVYAEGTGFQFVDPSNGWMLVNELVPDHLAGVRGVIARTEDGGRTWEQSFAPGCRDVGCSPFGQISFRDARDGWLLTSSSRGARLLRTGDAGRTWKLVSRPPVFGPITFVDPREGFLTVPTQILGPFTGTPGASLYRTTDGGRTWSQSFPWTREREIVQPLAAFGLRLVAAVLAPRHFQGWPQAVYTSADGGAGWTRHPFPEVEYVGPTSFSAASPTTWFVAGHRTLFVTNDAGASWRRIVLRKLPWRSRIAKIVFTSPQSGWALIGRGFGGHEHLFRTTDGGRHWTPAGPHKPKPHRH